MSDLFGLWFTNREKCDDGGRWTRAHALGRPLGDMEIHPAEDYAHS